MSSSSRASPPGPLRSFHRTAPRRAPVLLRVALWAATAALLLTLLALMAYGAVFFRADRSVEQLTPKWGQAPSQFVDVDGLWTHVRDVGRRDDPTPLVLIHGTESGLTTWEPWIASLSARHRVITVDLPGFGLTGPFEDGNYGTAHYVRFIVALLDKLGVQRCLLIGHDFGGEVAWQTAYLQPDRVSRLVLISAQGYPTEPWKRPLDERLLDTPVLNWMSLVTQPRFVVEKSLATRFASPERVTPALLERYEELPLRAGNRAARLARFEQQRFGTQADRLTTLHLPTLIVWGEQDRQIPTEQARWFQRDIAGSQLAIIPGVGHLPQEEAPEATLAEVARFVGR